MYNKVEQGEQASVKAPLHWPDRVKEFPDEGKEHSLQTPLMSFSVTANNLPSQITRIQLIMLDIKKANPSLFLLSYPWVKKR